MTPESLDCVPVSLVEMDKCIEVADGIFITPKQTGGVQINTRDDNGKPLIDTLYNLLFALYFCDKLFPSLR